MTRDNVTEKLQQTEDRLTYGADKATAFLDLLRNPGQLYLDGNDAVRRDLLAAFFTRILIDVDDDLTLTSERTPANTAIRQLTSQTGSAVAPHLTPETEKPPQHFR